MSQADAAPVLLIGDSITAHWARFRPGFFRRHGLVNAGVGGETTRQIRARFAAAVDAVRPRAVHLMGGLNDIAENDGPVPLSATQDNLAWMIDHALAAGCQPLVGSVTPAAILAWNPRVAPAGTIIELNGWLAVCAGGKGVPFLDYHGALRTPDGALRDGLGPDGSHLRARGYRLIEPILLDALAARFGPAYAEPSWSPRRVWGWLRARAASPKET